MRPAIGQDDLIMLLGEGFVDTVPITDQHHLHEVGVGAVNMGFGHGGPTAWGDVVEDHRRGTGHLQIPAMPRFALHRCKDIPPRFVATKQLLAHLALPQRLHDRLEERRDLQNAQ